MMPLRRLPFLLLLIAPVLVQQPALGAQTCPPNNVLTTPNGDFTDNGDGTVTHGKTGLTWQRCLLGQTWDGNATPPTCTGSPASLTWPNALQAAANSTFANHSDWRLPNIKELRSIAEQGCASPAINSTLFPGDPGGWTWSSTSFTYHAGSAWLIDFDEGFVRVPTDKTIAQYARLVRGGLSLGDFDWQAHLPPGVPPPDPTPTEVSVSSGGTVTLDGALPVHLDSGAAGAVLTVNTSTPLTFTVNGSDISVRASSGSVVEVTQVTVNGQTVLALVVTQGHVALTASEAGQVLLVSGGEAVQADSVDTVIVAQPSQISVVAGSVTLPGNVFAAGAITTLYAGEVAQLNDAGKITRIRLGSADGKGGLVGDPLPLSDKPSGLTIGIAVPRLSGAIGRLPGGLEAALASALGGSGRQNSAGSFNLAGSPAFNLLPLGDIVIDGSLADGVKLNADGLTRVVKDSVAVTLAPAPRDLYQFANDLVQAMPGATLTIREGGVLVVSLHDLRYVVRPAQLVEAAGGPAGFSSGQDGVLRYGDGQGGQQALNPAFLDYAATRALLESVAPGTQAVVEADGSISLTLGNSRFRLTPDPLLTPLDSRSALHVLNGEKWWLGTDGKVYLNVGGAVQGVAVR